MKITKDRYSKDGNSLIRGNLRIEWVELGEGVNGEYNPDNPNDIELLRFDVSIREGREWSFIDASSYCTQVPVTANKSQRKTGLKLIMDEIAVTNSIRRTCEQLSWIGLEDINNGKIIDRFSQENV